MRLFQHRSSGFTLIELLIAIAIIGIMTATVVPFLQQMQSGYERKQFIARVNSLTQIAWQQAIITRSVHRILFNTRERSALIEKDITESAAAKKLDFQPLRGVQDSSINWPRSIEIKQFIVGDFDEMKRFGGRKTENIWFYIIPDGMTQEVTINFIDKEDLEDAKPKQFGLVMNPYNAQFKVYNAFQK